jgi:hypothetical protein
MSDDAPIPPKEIPSFMNPVQHQCFLLYLAGWGSVEIEKETGQSAINVRQWACRGGWAEHRKYYEGMMKRKHPPLSQPIVQAVVRNAKEELRKKYLEKTGVMAAEDADYWADLKPEERLAVAPDLAALDKVHRGNLGLNEESETKATGHINLTFLTSNTDSVRVLKPAKVTEIEDAQPTTEE